ncbi:MAG: DnaJ domain-containing protein [Rhodospirillaceae bacterium]|nr:DnaJ domain-containing protein [Rhodospirillaceae bacterium]
MNLRDPKGYYIALGIDENADADAIKAAYRSKAKRLHPDFNPSPIAAKQFHRLHEAYETLSDPGKRATYDRPWKNKDNANGHTSANGNAYAYNRHGEGKRDPEMERKERKQEPPRAEARNSPKSAYRTQARANTGEQPAVCKCGKVTAQPRYIIFDLVWGRITKVQRRGLSGIYCRSCADRTAVRASLITWLAGWWALPHGPKETVKALITNVRGGRKPADRNARLLMRQSRAFKARGEMELARNAAEQAISFAATPQLRHDVDTLLLSLSSHPARALKDRWNKPGWAATAQILPLAIIVGVVSMSATMLSPVPLTMQFRNFIAAIDVPAAITPSQDPAGTLAPLSSMPATGRIYSVAAKLANLRTGPGSNYQLVAVLGQGTIVLVTEADPAGQWLRVTTPDGATGFMSVNQLSPDVRIDALDDIGGFGGKPAEKPAQVP